jgi:hypothetical protein
MGEQSAGHRSDRKLEADRNRKLQKLLNGERDTERKKAVFCLNDAVKI